MYFLILSEDDKVGTLDVLLSSAYCRSQRFLSKQLAQLRPELTMSMFSGKKLVSWNNKDLNVIKVSIGSLFV